MACQPCSFGKHIGIPFDPECQCSCHDYDRMKQRAEQAERERDEVKLALISFRDLAKTRADYIQTLVKERDAKRERADRNHRIAIRPVSALAKEQIRLLKIERDEARAKVERLRAAAKEYHEEDGQCSWGFDLCKPCPLCAALEDSK